MLHTALYYATKDRIKEAYIAGDVRLLKILEESLSELYDEYKITAGQLEELDILIMEYLALLDAY